MPLWMTPLQLRKKPAIDQMTTDRRAFDRKAFATSVIALALAACSGSGENPPGAVSEGEKQALRDAAEMLDEQRPPVNAIAPTVAEEPNTETGENAQVTGDGAPQPNP